MSTMELRLGLRLIARQPILSATIVLALATGICAATIGFTFRDVLLNSTLPYAAGDRFVRIVAFTAAGDRLDPDIERYHAFRDHAASFDHVGVVISRAFAVTHGPGDVESVAGAWITPRSMRWVEAVPMAGRAFVAADGEPGATPVVLIRDSFRSRRFAGERDVIGRQITVAGQPRTVVGVMPDSFGFPSAGELWLPFDELTLNAMSETTAGVRMIGVLKPDASLDHANAEVAALSAPLPAGREPNQIARVEVQKFPGESGEANLAMSALVFVLVLVLLVVASNVATLILARTWARAPELAVRTALGAPRARVVRQLFIETLLLGSIAASLGAGAAFVILRYIRASITDMPFWITLAPTPRTVAFAVFLALLVSVVAGLFPALRVTRHDLRTTLQGGRGFAAGGFGRFGAALLVLEIALSVGLLNGAVTMAKAFEAYGNDVPALPRNEVLTVQIGSVSSPELRGRIVDAVSGLASVSAAGAGETLPRLYTLPKPTVIEVMDGETPQAAMPAPSFAVGKGFLEAVGARALSGRLFTAMDFTAKAAPIAVVNEPFVQKFLGGRNPIGRRIRVVEPREDGQQEPWREIVGVVPDLGLSVANAAFASGFYTPVAGEHLYYLAVRTGGDPMALAPQIRAAVAGVDPDLQLDGFQTLDEAGSEERIFLSSVASALTAMGVVALMLSVVGIYALLSFMVTRRTREIGIRVALGATRVQVLRMIAGGAAVYLAIGGAIGSALGLLSLQMRSILLISIPEFGLWMPLTIFTTLAIAGGLACWLPARRALNIRPAEALSADR